MILSIWFPNRSVFVKPGKGHLDTWEPILLRLLVKVHLSFRKKMTLKKKVSARFDVHATITECAYRILKTVLKFMFFKITQALA